MQEVKNLLGRRGVIAILALALGMLIGALVWAYVIPAPEVFEVTVAPDVVVFNGPRF